METASRENHCLLPINETRTAILGRSESNIFHAGKDRSAIVCYVKAKLQQMLFEGCKYRHPGPRRVWKGCSEQQKMKQKHKNKFYRASSRRLDFVGRLHTSATSPLMKASRNGSKQAPASVSAPSSKGRARGSQERFPGTIPSSNYVTNSRYTALSGRYF